MFVGLFAVNIGYWLNDTDWFLTFPIDLGIRVK